MFFQPGKDALPEFIPLQANPGMGSTSCIPWGCFPFALGIAGEELDIQEELIEGIQG